MKLFEGKIGDFMAVSIEYSWLVRQIQNLSDRFWGFLFVRLCFCFDARSHYVAKQN